MASQPPQRLVDTIQARAQDPIFKHPVLGSEARDFWILSLTRIALQVQDREWVASLREPLEQMQTRWQGPQVWQTLAQVYQQLDDSVALQRHLDWVAALQPSAVAPIQAGLD